MGTEKQVKKLEQYKQERRQMALFEVLPRHDKYSNTIELYDAIPKYFWGKPDRKDNQYLDPLTRSFEFRGRKYKVVISPAKIQTKDGLYRDCYPAIREEIVEDGLRKLACDGHGLFLDDEAAVVFSLYQLQMELTRMGHTYSKDQIKEALLVCAKTNIEVKSEDGSAVMISNIFSTLGLHTQENSKEPKNKSRAFVRFNPLVTQCIKDKTFRQLNYKECMTYRNSIARWLHKRMSHIYLQASYTHPYTIMLSTIIRDSGMKAYAQLRDNLRKVEEAIEEMQERQVVMMYDTKKVLENGKKTILDAKFILTPGSGFVNDMKKANAKMKAIKSE